MSGAGAGGVSSSRRILVGLAAGIAVGVFLGDRATVFAWAADGFVKLLQMTVLPYVILSIVTSLGSLTYAEARTLGLRAGAVLAGLWALALVFTSSSRWRSRTCRPHRSSARR